MEGNLRAAYELTVLGPINTNKTCSIKPGLTKWKLATESWTIGVDIGFK